MTEHNDRTPCPDCTMCQGCSAARCRVCRFERKARSKKRLSPAEQIELYNSLNPCFNRPDSCCAGRRSHGE